jgi:hypothetical protein
MTGSVKSGKLLLAGSSAPDFAEFIIGPAEGRKRWLNPGYSSQWRGATHGFAVRIALSSRASRLLRTNTE